MPELPEVETTLRGLNLHIKNQKINNVIIRQHQLRWPIPANLKSKLVDQSIQKLARRGKYLLIHLETGTIIIHLGMSGSLRILTETISPKAHDHVDILFNDNKVLRYTDPRRFGAILWTEELPAQHNLLKHLGIEPLEKQFTGEYLWQKALSSRVFIKPFIMDNKIVVGVGNIYATEALFLAKIHPLTPSHLMTKQQCQQLVTSIRKTLRLAIQRGGTSLKDFVNAHGKPGYFSQKLKVYGRTGLPCIDCGTPLQSLMLAQRNTVFCTKCQYL